MSGNGPPRAREPAELEAVRKLHAEGMGRNRIASTLNMSRRAVGECADQLGVRFDGSQTRNATLTAQQNRRSRLLDVLGDVAEQSARRLLVEVQAEVLDASAVRALSAAVTASTERWQRLDPFTEEGDANAENLLERLVEGFHRQAEIDRGEIES